MEFLQRQRFLLAPQDGTSSGSAPREKKGILQAKLLDALEELSTYQPDESITLDKGGVWSSWKVGFQAKGINSLAIRFPNDAIGIVWEKGISDTQYERYIMVLDQENQNTVRQYTLPAGEQLIKGFIHDFTTIATFLGQQNLQTTTSRQPSLATINMLTQAVEANIQSRKTIIARELGVGVEALAVGQVTRIFRGKIPEPFTPLERRDETTAITSFIQSVAHKVAVNLYTPNSNHVVNIVHTDGGILYHGVVTVAIGEQNIPVTLTYTPETSQGKEDVTMEFSILYKNEPITFSLTADFGRLRQQEDVSAADLDFMGKFRVMQDRLHLLLQLGSIVQDVGLTAPDDQAIQVQDIFGEMHSATLGQLRYYIQELTDFSRPIPKVLLGEDAYESPLNDLQQLGLEEANEAFHALDVELTGQEYPVDPTQIPIALGGLLDEQTREGLEQGTIPIPALMQQLEDALTEVREEIAATGLTLNTSPLLHQAGNKNTARRIVGDPNAILDVTGTFKVSDEANGYTFYAITVGEHPPTSSELTNHLRSLR